MRTWACFSQNGLVATWYPDVQWQMGQCGVRTAGRLPISPEDYAPSRGVIAQCYSQLNST